MTAMVSVKATTRQERLEAARTEWIQAAITYLFKLGVYAPDELEGACNSSGSRTADVHIIENAIRNALAIYTEKLEIQMKQHYFVDLGKS